MATREHAALLKGGVETRNPAFDAPIERVERVATVSDAPILLLGPSGSGRTELAHRLYELGRRRLKGRLGHVHCGTLRGEDAAAALVGTRRGVVGGAGPERRDLPREADGGLLFLDEVDGLGRGEQAMILHAVETGRLMPLGSDAEASSRFHLIASAGGDLAGTVAAGRFRPDLHARLSFRAFRPRSLSGARTWSPTSTPSPPSCASPATRHALDGQLPRPRRLDPAALHAQPPRAHHAGRRGGGGRAAPPAVGGPRPRP